MTDAERAELWRLTESVMAERDRLAAEVADLKAVKVAYEEAPKDARNSTTAGVTWDTVRNTVGRVLDSQTIRDLRAEVARLRVLLQRAADIHDGGGVICVDGRDSDTGEPCPSCELNKEIRSALEPK